jgi:hypothetical protein
MFGIDGFRSRTQRGRPQALPVSSRGRWAYFVGVLIVLAAGLAGCDVGGSEARGVVEGSVSAEGAPLSNVTVELSGPLTRATTTDASGRYRFEEIPVGAYVASVRDLPFDVTFPALSRPAIVRAGESVSVDFSGNVIRTAAISGVVRSGDQGIQGVTVVLGGGASTGGAGAASVQTDARGEFRFTALRSGTYTVEISGFGPTLQFPVTRSTVVLSSGQEGAVVFEGTRQLTASAVIRSLQTVSPTGVREPADPRAIRGRIEVNVTLDRGVDTADSLVVLLGEQVVGTQRFTSGPSGGSPAGDGPSAPSWSEDAPNPVAPVDLVFSIETGAFNESTGVTRFPNGEHLLSVRLATREGGPRAWTTSVPLTLTNRDTFVAQLLPARGPMPDDQGLLWMGGDLNVRVLPVVFTPGRVVTSVVLELRRTGGALVARASALGEGPLMVRFPAEGVGEASLAGYATPAGSTDEVRVVQAGYGDGTAVSSLPLTVATGVRLDLAPPVIERFELPTQGATTTCCVENWVGVAFRFVDVIGAVTDPGAGGTTLRVHAGAAALSDAQLLGLPPVQTGADLPSSVGNTSYRALAVAEDRLGNRRVVRLSAGAGNPLTGAGGGALFGVDHTRPVAALAPGGTSLADGSVNPPDGSLWVLNVLESGASGLPGTLPARVTIRRDGPGDPSSGVCVFPAADPTCTPVLDALLRPVPLTGMGYFTYRAQVTNRAGTLSLPVVARMLRDDTPPVVTALSVSPVRVGGQEVVLGGEARDDVDLFAASLSFGFGGTVNAPTLILPLARPDTLGTPFGVTRVEGAVFQGRIPFVQGVQRALSGTAGDAPGGDVFPSVMAEAVVLDAARNAGALRVPFATTGGSPLLGFDEAARGSNAVRGWRVSGPSGVSAVCATPSGCSSGSPGSVRLTAEARGEVGFQVPFRWVYFVVDGPRGPALLGRVEGALASTVSGPPAERGRWTWTLDWTPEADFPAGAVGIRAIGVDANGNGLVSPVLTSLTVERAGG